MTALKPASSNRLNALVAKHSAVEEKILKEEKRPLPSTYLLKSLKQEKLQLKEDIEMLKQA